MIFLARFVVEVLHSLTSNNEVEEDSNITL